MTMCRRYASQLEHALEGLGTQEFGMLLARCGLCEHGGGANPPEENISEEQGKRIALQVKLKTASLNEDLAQLQSSLIVTERSLGNARQEIQKLEAQLDGLRAVQETLVNRNVEVECLERELAQATEQISSLSDQVFLQVEAGEMHKQLENASARNKELEAWLATREADLTQAESRCVQFADENDVLMQRMREMELVLGESEHASARSIPHSAKTEEHERTIRRLQGDIEKLRKTIQGKDDEIRREQARADCCKQAMVQSKRASDSRERVMMAELAESRREGRKAQELCKMSKSELDSLRRKHDDYKKQHLAANRPSEPDGVCRDCRDKDVRLDELERRIRMLGEQRKSEQEAVMMHMRGSDEEVCVSLS
jgi:chromosome segregation ATPase